MKGSRFKLNVLTKTNLETQGSRTKDLLTKNLHSHLRTISKDETWITIFKKKRNSF